MSQSSSVSAQGFIAGPTRVFTTFTNSIGNILKIDWVFKVSIAGIVFCYLYKLYKTCCPSLVLDDKLKAIKASALFYQAQKTAENVQFLPKECEDLLTLTPPESCKDILLKLAQYYATSEPAKSWKIAERISCPYQLLEIVQRIRREHPDFVLTPLPLTRAFKLHDDSTRRIQTQLEHVQQSLCFAKLFKLLQPEDEENSIAHAINLIPLTHFENFRGTCKVAIYYQETSNPEASTTIKMAKDWANELLQKVPLTWSVYYWFVLAEMYFSVEEYQQMHGELQSITEWFKSRDVAVMEKCKHLNRLVMFAKKISRDVPEGFRYSEVGFCIDQVMCSNFAELSAKEQAGAYLYIAAACKATNDQLGMQRYRGLAFEAVQRIDETDFSAKDLCIGLILLYGEEACEERQESIRRLEAWYRSFDEAKWMYGIEILSVYNKIEYKSEIPCEDFCQISVSTRPFGQISHWLSYAQQLIDFNDIFHAEQILKMAEDLLSSLSHNEYAEAALAIAEAYLTVNPQESLRLIQNYELCKKAADAAIRSIAMRILNPYVWAPPIIALGLFVYLKCKI